MKILLTMLLLSSLAFSNVSVASEKSDKILGFGLSTLIWGPAAAVSYIYAPALSLGALQVLGVVGVLGTSITLTLNDKAAKEIRTLVNNDAQDFYANGRLSVELAKSIEILKEENADLSDVEAVDQIVVAVNQ